MPNKKPWSDKPVSGWIALALGILAVLGTVLYFIADFVPIFDMPLFCFTNSLPFILGAVGLMLSLLGLHAANRRPALAAVVLNGLVLLVFIGIIISSSNQPPNQVAALTPQSGGYDLAAYACQANWFYPSYMMTVTGNRLVCGSKLLPSNGLVLPLETVTLNNGEIVGPVLWLEKAADREYLASEYPLYEVQPGDLFSALIGCAQDQPYCDTIVTISFLYENWRSAQEDAQVEVRYDQPPVEVSVALTGLAGEQIFINIGIAPYQQDDSLCQATIIAPRIGPLRP